MKMNVLQLESPFTLTLAMDNVLKCNNFEFNGKHNLQIQGMAMGTIMAPSYANIFWGRLEKQLIQSVSLKPVSLLRFIDDIDMKWIHGRCTLFRSISRKRK